MHSVIYSKAVLALERSRALFTARHQHSYSEKKQMHERELRALPHPSQSTFYDPFTFKPWIHREKNPLIHIYILYFFHNNLTILSQRRHLSWGRSAVWALIPIKHQMYTWGSELLCILLDRKRTTKWGNASLKKRKHSFLFVIPCLAFWENCWEIDVAVNLRPSVTLLIEKNDLKEKKQSLKKKKINNMVLVEERKQTWRNMAVRKIYYGSQMGLFLAWNWKSVS